MQGHSPRIFTGSAHPQLALDIAEHLSVPIGKSQTKNFPDTEIHVKINEVVREQDIYLIQPCPPPVNDHLMELILYLDAFRRASVNSVTVIIPYYPYARQDRMAKGREAISARVVANLLENQGAQRIIFMDIHNQAIQGFFNIPVDPLTAIPVLGDYFKQPKFSNAAIVSPDVGRAGLAGLYAEYLHLPLVVMHKRREAHSTKVKTTHIVGDIRGRTPIIIDDMIASGSVMKQIDALYDQGAEGKAYFAITHPVLLPSATQILENDDRIEKLITTNTIPIPADRMSSKIQSLSIAPMLAKIISCVHEGESISDMLVM
jgi:ribose-phosphate pyrophosphokinase